MKRPYAQLLLCPSLVCAGLAAALMYLPYKIVFTCLALAGVLISCVLCIVLKNTARYRAAAIVVALCIGMFAAVRSIRIHDSEKLAAGLDEQYVKKITVKIIATSGKTSKGYYKMTGRLISVHGDYGSSASAQGICMLISDTELVTGSLVEVPLSSDFEKGIFFVRSKDVYMQKIPGIHEQIRFFLRKKVEGAIEKSSGNAAPLVKALLTGYRGDLENESVQIFIRAGCAHILALSGQHVAVIVSLLGIIIRTIFGKKHEFVICFCLLIVFSWFTGASPSVVRAVLQFAIAGICSSMGRPQKNIIVFSYSFIAAICLFPESPYTLSFQLSYLAVLGIILFNDTCVFMLRRWFPQFAANALSQGVSALIGTVLLSVSVFNKINILSPITSALVSPFVTCLIIGGIVGSIIVSFIPLLKFITQYLLEKIEAVMLELTQAGGRIGIIQGIWIGKVYILLVIIAAVLYCLRIYRAWRFRIMTIKKLHMYDCYVSKPQDYNETIAV
ncbi:MAG TPA: ComEC/Rec2 family competence protein [Spirochaetia bacterium]|nr:ComEC/Rec2 family competence protein [Spirochaetales bacterium]HQK35050.1 ComEC/Rec2 family competence protein [Spirochaetales bacterium]HRS64567.1 ComEC/Rec2 family competence protein [Spirochaetia bacterium]HRV27407.1 ComEC/Rec2 family competence protein [Spirochaetia bacterium]